MLIFNAIFPVITIAAIGYIWGKKQAGINTSWLTDIVIYLGSPALAFSVIIQAAFTWKYFLVVFLSAVIVVLVGLILARIVFGRLLGNNQTGAILPIVFLNSGNLGLSISYFAFGQSGLTVAIIFHIAMVILVYSLGIHILTKDEHPLRVFKLPHIYACGLALFFNFSQIEPPLVILRTVDLIGQVTIPMMLLLLGIQLASTHFGQNWKLAVTGAFLRGSIGILGAALAIGLFGLHGETAKVIMLLSILPSAVITQTLAQKYNKDSELCSSIIAASTLMGLFYIPLALFFLTI
ncbi:MAG: AEC family transporter [Candidatus Margulisiibacteriota bacterium]